VSGAGGVGGRATGPPEAAPLSPPACFPSAPARASVTAALSSAPTHPIWNRMKLSAQGFSSVSRLGWPRLLPLKLTTSRSRQKWGSCVTCEGGGEWEAWPGGRQQAARSTPPARTLAGEWRGQQQAVHSARLPVRLPPRPSHHPQPSHPTPRQQQHRRPRGRRAAPAGRRSATHQ
jgi:hypothetical protein